MNNQQEKTVLPSALRLQLKKSAHHIKPVAQIGKHGITDAFLSELDRALNSHELIKIKLPKNSLEHSKLMNRIVSETASLHIDTVGKVAILFRKREISRLDSYGE